MRKFSVADGGNADGTAKDRVGLTAGTTYYAKYWNDNMFNLFDAITNAGYTLIDDDLSQITKAFRGGYNAAYTYNTASIASQSVDDIVLGSNGIYYKCLTNGTIGDNPVGSITGNWEVYLDPNIAASISKSTSKTTPADADSFGITDSDASNVLKKITWANVKTALTSTFAPLASPTFTGTVGLPATAVRQIGDAVLGTGTHTFNYANGDMQQLQATGNISIAFDGFPAGKVCAFIIDAADWGSYTITHPANMFFAGGIAPTYTSAGIDRLLVTKDKDESYTLTVIAQDIKAVAV